MNRMNDMLNSETLRFRQLWAYCHKQQAIGARWCYLGWWQSSIFKGRSLDGRCRQILLHQIKVKDFGTWQQKWPWNPSIQIIMSSCHHVPWIRHWAPLDTTVEHSLGPQPQAAWVVWFPKGQGLPQILGLMGAPPCQGLRGNWKRTPTIGYGHCLIMVGNNI
jgi:hypothetical protein